MAADAVPSGNEPGTPAPGIGLFPAHVVVASRYLLVDLETNEGHPLKKGLNTLGRSKKNDIPLPDSAVSRRHCLIWVDDKDMCELNDLGSHNGTWWNDQRVAGPTPLRLNDRLRVGSRTLVLLEVEEYRLLAGKQHDSQTLIDPLA